MQVDVRFSFLCNSCGSSLTAAYDPDNQQFDVDPCEDCTQGEYNIGLEEGKELAEEKAEKDIADAYDEGYAAGVADGKAELIEDLKNEKAESESPSDTYSPDWKRLGQ